MADVSGVHDESINSSVARAAGIASIGDTKSIVLALQSLQEKIRKLEQDRNFHQEQCEAARAAHDAYKREVEVQLENERRAHRLREQELLEMINRANAERARLQGTLEESKHDISSFRAELETLLERERLAAKEREERLRDEIEAGRKELLGERRSLEQIRQTIEQVKTEKEIVLSTNRRLEGTIKDLIAMNNGLMDKARRPGSATTAAALSAGVASSRRGSLGPGSRHADPHSANVSRDSAAARGNPAAAATARRPTPQRSASSHYRSPTHSSEIKCSRCVTHHVLEEGPLSGSSALNVSRGRAVTASARPSSAPRRASQDGRRPHTGAHSAVAQSQLDAASGAEQVDALDEVYEGLVREHRELNAKYKEIIERANAPGAHVTPEVLTATLNSVMAQIDRKAEQMRLLRSTRAELGGGSIEGGRRRSPQPRGAEKAAKKGALVNELRSLFAKAAHS